MKKNNYACCGALLCLLVFPGLGGAQAEEITERYEVTLALTKPVPARINCTILGGAGTRAKSRNRTRTVDFDPVDDLPLTRTVRLSIQHWRQGQKPTLTVLCRSTPLRVSAGGASETVFEFWGRIQGDVDAVPKTLDLLGRTWDSKKTSPVATNPSVGEISVAVNKVDAANLTTLSPQAGRSVASTRSLDLLSKVGEELLEATAEVVVERAKRRGMRLLSKRLTTDVCENMVLLSKPKTATALAAAARKAVADNDSKHERLLPRTCEALEGIALADIMASGEILRRSLTGDLVNFATGTILNYVDVALEDDLVQEDQERVHAILKAVSGLAVRLAEGEKTLTEADFQYLTLTLADIAGKQPNANSPLLLALHGALMSLTECLAEGTCEADRLAYLVQSYLDDQVEGNYADVAAITSIALRAKQVLRPPPGASPSEVANVALHLALDVVQLILEQELNRAKYVTSKSKELESSAKSKILEKIATLNADALSDGEKYALTDELFRTVSETVMKEQTVPKEDSSAAKSKQEKLQTVLALLPRLRALLDGVTRRDLAGGLQAAIPLVIAATTAGCKKKCVVKFSDDNLKKWFRIIGAIVSYSTSYAKIEGEDQAAIEKQRGEIRKKAMNDLIDAATDRTGRDDDRIWSLGAGVGFGRLWVGKNGDEGFEDDLALSIPLGLSVEFKTRKPILPLFGATAMRPHIQFSALDLANYLRKEGGEVVEPNLYTAVDFNARLSMAFWDYVDVGAVIGWTPYQKGDDGEISELQGGYAGVFVGTYIPIFDLN